MSTQRLSVVSQFWQISQILNASDILLRNLSIFFAGQSFHISTCNDTSKKQNVVISARMKIWKKFTVNKKKNNKINYSSKYF